MLKILYGGSSDEIYNTSLYFDNTYLDDWITGAFAKDVLKNIDKATVLSGQAVDSEALGVIPTTKISGGSKTVLLIYNESEKLFNASTCGNNCAPFILRIPELLKKDVTIALHHLMNIGDGEFEIEIANTGIIVHNMKELVINSLDILHQGDGK